MLWLSILTERNQYKYHIYAYFILLKNGGCVFRKFYVEQNNKGNKNI